jgi:hypothetical protein
MVPIAGEAIRRLCQDLGLPPGDRHSQDWVYELPGEFRTIDWFRKYADAYRRFGYGADERVLLVHLLFDVANDLLLAQGADESTLRTELHNIVRDNPSLHREQVEYWCLFGNEMENTFEISRCAREIWNNLYENASTSRRDS